MPFELTDMEGRFLVQLARQSISAFLDAGEKTYVPPNISVALREKCGVFVTLNVMRDGAKTLRGCIGYPEPLLPLAQATITSAINSATRDPRFPLLSKEELELVVIEVSVLTPPTLITVKTPMEYVTQVDVGKDGLIVERGRFKGLLLPQVSVEWGWNAEEFLTHCCMKAGLSPDAWLVVDSKIYKFSCIIARETRPSGPVEVIDMRKGEQP
ncbi:MAG: TIGR00296 family protein [Candidatus Bathyarchaeia archaeon]